MNQLIRSLAAAVIIAISFSLFSCDDNEDGFGLTGKNGLPSMFRIDDNETYLSYSGNQLLLMMYENGATTAFNYEENAFQSISLAPPPYPSIADGHGFVRFERKGNKIRVISSGEPTNVASIKEIELDKNELPAKITDMGYFEPSSEGYQKLYNGKDYSVLTFDPVTKNLLKRDIFSLKDSILLKAYTYKYDNSPGSMSRVELPSWFYAYWYQNYAGTAIFSQFLNHHNNMTEETVTDKETGEIHTTYNKYAYNGESYPVSCDNGNVVFEIRY